MYYRKYRPQTFNELDNSRVRESLGKSLLDNKFSHAYLLIGTRGSGKTTTARLIAKTVNCTNRKKGEEPCNRCDSCKTISKGTSLDVIEIDAASNTGVDDIRDLREKVKLAPTTSKYKVYIIDEVHMLSMSAFNALLKTLEEPPEHVIFVLCTTDPQRLPETIVSRCLVYDFGRGTKEEIVRSLKRVVTGEELKVEDGVLELIANRADGSMRDGQKILEQLAMEGRKIRLEDVQALASADLIKETVKQLIKFLEEKDAKKSLIAIEEFVEKNGRIRDLIIELADQARLLLIASQGAGEKPDLKFSVVDLEKLLSGLIEANSLMRDSPIAQLPLEMVIVEFCQNNRSSDETQKNSIDQSDQKVPEDQPIRNSDFSDKTEISGNTDAPAHRVKSDLSEIRAMWPKVLEEVKPYNHSLVALLRASRPKEIEGQFLTVEVFYKFHKEKLSEPKNREILEKVVSGIINKEIKIKFLLAEKK